jgi:hypothetical protein
MIATMTVRFLFEVCGGVGSAIVQHMGLGVDETVRLGHARSLALEVRLPRDRVTIDPVGLQSEGSGGIALTMDVDH